MSLTIDFREMHIQFESPRRSGRPSSYRTILTGSHPVPKLRQKATPQATFRFTEATKAATRATRAAIPAIRAVSTRSSVLTTAVISPSCTNPHNRISNRYGRSDQISLDQGPSTVTSKSSSLLLQISDHCLRQHISHRLRLLRSIYM